ncbi:MAG: formate dehydrogenase accessory sulfurtransferase FdhD [Acidimicrobiia bacterium]|jgi:FdhD protein
MTGASTERSVTRIGRGVAVAGPDSLVVEAPLEIRLHGVPLAVIMRTPGDEGDLIRGFALTEGIVLRPGELAEIRSVAGDAAGDRWEMVPAPGVTIDPEQFRRNFYATSSCGVCGKASIDAVRVSAGRPGPGPLVESAVVMSLPGRMLKHQTTFALTGGLHAAALFRADGELVVVREDVGRHNAVDKVIGASVALGMPAADLILAVSGRVSFEIAQKAAVAGIPVVCGVSAASSLAVELAEEFGLTVVGFVRDGEAVVYAGVARILAS